MTETLEPAAAVGSDARERILAAAYDLFSRRGVRDVDMDEIVERSGVAKATLDRHFPSKDDLVLAFLGRREEVWTHEWLEAEARQRAETPEEQLLAIFDVFDGWFRQADLEGCSFIDVLLEMRNGHAVGAASAGFLESIRALIGRFAKEADLREPEAFAHSWHILMKGAIVAAGEGDIEAAQRAKRMGRLLIEQYR